MSLFSQEISKQKQSTLFGAPIQNKPNEEQKNNINSSLFSNEKTPIFGAMFSNITSNEPKKDQEINKQNNLFGSNLKKNLFEIPEIKESENDSGDKNKEKQGGLFKFGLFDTQNKKEEDKNKNSLFTSPKQEKEEKKIAKSLFQSNIDTNLNINKITEEKNEKKDSEKKENTIPKTNENNVIFDKKVETNLKNLFEPNTSLKPNQIANPINDNLTSASTNISSNKNNLSTKQTSNNLSSSSRIEDNKQIQNALENLYISDILLKSPFDTKYSLTKSQQINSKYFLNKKSKTIDFKFFLEIKDIPNIKDEGCNMICKSDESMSKLLKQAQLYVKKKYKMTKEIDDFHISLKKNGYILPINDIEYIGDYIKNNDKIIIYMVHNSSAKNEEEEKIYRINQIKEENNISINNSKINEEQEEDINKNTKNQKTKEDKENKKEDKLKEKEEKINKYLKNRNFIELINFKGKSKSSPDGLINKRKEALCPTNKLPILKREGYFMIPNEYAISRMTINEIKHVENFTIFNENGKIEFEGRVSLFGVNFDKLFNIEHEFIEYEKGEWCHSPRGQNFNIPAKITFYNIKPDVEICDDNDKKMFIDMLEIKCKKYLNAKFISYDFDNETLIYRIPYFY